MSEKINPCIGDQVFAVTKHGKIVPTLICGLHSRSYDGGDGADRFGSGRTALPHNSAMYNVSILASATHSFFTFEAAAAHAMTRIQSDIKNLTQITHMKQAVGRRQALTERRDVLKQRACRVRTTYWFDRRAYADFYESVDRSMHINTNVLQFDHLPIESVAFRIDTQHWKLIQVVITGIYYWPHLGFMYEFGSLNRERVDRVYGTQAEALSAMEILFSEHTPGSLDVSRVQTEILLQAKTQAEESDYFVKTFNFM